LVVEATKRRVVARTDRRQEGHEEVLVVIRYRDRDNDEVVKTDYYLSNAKAETELAEFTHAAKAEHRIEECIQRGKSEAGLADYEVRTWKGWHHHQILSLIASWFLVTEARRGKKMDTGNHRSTNPQGHRIDPTSRLRMRYQLPHFSRTRTASQTQRTCSPVSLEAA
jgi:SRSO17 transposase